LKGNRRPAARCAGGRAPDLAVNIVIVGLGEVGQHLAGSLLSQGHDLSLIESSETLAEELDERLDARVICGDGSSVLALAEARVAEADLFMALSGDNDANLMASSLAKALGVKRAISRVHPRVQREEWLFNYRQHFGIDYLFSTQRLAAVELAKHVRNPEGLLVEEIARGRIEVQQVQVAAGLALLGKPLRELSLPPRVRIGSIQRGERLLVAGAADVLEAGDLVTLFGEPLVLAELA